MIKATRPLFYTALIAGTGLFAIRFSPLSLNSKLERIFENNLPAIRIENSSIIYCRMQADDFRFPLPPRSKGVNLVITGSFDSIDGTVEARFEGNDQVTVSEYMNLLSGKIQVGGQVAAEAIPGGLLIKFHYFGDK